MSISTIRIGNLKLGGSNPPVVIAEIGINHNGNFQTAKKMCKLAIESGADIIKFQTHIPKDEMISEAKNIIPINANISIYKIMEKCSLNENEEIKIKKYVESKNKIFLSTPFSRAAALRLKKIGVKAYKIGSGECNNYPLIDLIASFKKPMIVSTGMNNIKSIKKTVKIIKKYKTPFALLHTTNLYPTPYKLVRLGALKELQKNFKNIPIGLSDHTISNHACFSAVALGAKIVERHFTDTMKRKGPDIINSMDPRSLKELSTGLKLIHSMLGGKKEAAKEEKPTINFAFASVVSIKDIKKGEKFTKKNIWVKRPGTGDFLAEDYNKIIGKKSKTFVKSGIQIKKSFVF